MDINQLMQQAQAMQQQIEKATEQINATEFEGSASNGLVKVTINGENKVLSVSIDPEVIHPEDKEMLEDLVMIAVNNAIEKAQLHAFHTDVGAQLLAQKSRHATTQPALHKRQLDEYYKDDVQAQQTPYRPVDETLQSLQFRYLEVTNNDTMSYFDCKITTKSSDYTIFNRLFLRHIPNFY